MLTRGIDARDAGAGNRWLSRALIVAAAAIAELPALRGGFVWDDDHHVTAAGLRSLRGLWRIWAEPGATQQYYPVLHSAFWFEYRLWGESPLGYHALNLALHACAAVLFMQVLRRLAVPGAAFAALLFAVHPIGVESVAWISEQKNTLSAVFFLAAALAYLRLDAAPKGTGYSELEGDGRPKGTGYSELEGDGRPKGTGYSWAAAGLGLYVLAILTKSVTATLPAVLLVIAWWRRGRIGWRRDVAPLAPWFALGAAMSLMTIWVERHFVGAAGADYALSPAQRVLIAGRAMAFYLGHAIWPANLTFIYPHWEVRATVGWQYIFPAAAIAAATAACLYRRRSRTPFALCIIYFLTLLPALGFVDVYPFTFSYVADHFQYLALLPFLAVLSAGFVRLSSICLRHESTSSPPHSEPSGPCAPSASGQPETERIAPLVPSVGEGMRSVPVHLRSDRAWTPFAPPALAIIALATLAWRQAGEYRSAETLYRDTLAKNPSCWMAENNLGLILADRGRLDDAIVHYRRALRLKPSYPICWYNLGNAERARGDLPGAIACYRTSLGEQPNDPDVETNLAAALVAAGRPAEALDHYRAALALRPSASAAARVGLSIADLRAGDAPQAILDARAAVAAAQSSHAAPLLQAQAWYALADALVHSNRLPESVAAFQAAIRLEPDFAPARRNLEAVERYIQTNEP